MIQHKPILTDAEMHALISGNPFTLGLSIARLKDFIRQVEKAVVAKLVAEQEPSAFYIHDNKATDAYYTDHAPEAQEWAAKGVGVTALYAHPMPCVSTANDKAACVSESGEDDRQLARQQPCGCVVCYCENQERCLGCGAKHCGTHDVAELPNPVYVDHIADMRKMVECAKCSNPAIHHLIMDNLGYPNKTPLCGECTQEHEHLAQDTNDHEIRNFGGAYGLVSYHYEPLGTAQPDHIPDAGKMVNLSLSVDTKEAQALLQSYLDSLDGWQLVPPMPTDAMLKKIFPEIFDMDGMSKIDLMDRYQTMLAAAPKYTGGSDD